MNITSFAIMAVLGLLSITAKGAITYVTHNPTFPIAALTNPYGSFTLDGRDVLASITAFNSFPQSFSIVEVLVDGTNRDIYAVPNSPVVDAFPPQFGLPGGTSAYYSGIFSFSDSELIALESGCVASFTIFPDGSTQTDRFRLQVIPEPSAYIFFITGACLGALRGSRKRTRCYLQPAITSLFEFELPFRRCHS